MLNTITQTMAGRIRLSRLLEKQNTDAARIWDPMASLDRSWKIQSGLLAEAVLPGHEMEMAKWLQQIPDIVSLFLALEHCREQLSDKNDPEKWNRVQEGLLQNMGCHLPYFKRFRGKDELAAYCAAYEGAESSGAGTQFFGLDPERIVCGIKRYAKTGGSLMRIRELFRMLPYYTRPEYVFHAMRNNGWLAAADSMPAMSDRELAFIGMQTKTSWILSGHTAKIKTLVRESMKNEEAACYLSGLSRLMDGCFSSMEQGILYDRIAETLNMVTDSRLCLSILEPLRKHKKPLERMILLMSYLSYKPKSLRLVKRKAVTDTAACTAAMDGIRHDAMAAAWLLDRRDVLKLQETDWWKQEFDAEDDRFADRNRKMEKILIRAMAHNENAFLKALEEDENTYGILEYLAGHINIRLNTSLFSKKQLEELKKEDMLSQFLLPDWMEMESVTFDTVRVLIKTADWPSKDYQPWDSHEIRTLKDARKALLSVFRTLLEKCRTEEACRRMVQLLNAATLQDMGDITVYGAQLADRLQKHDLYTWSRKLFGFQASGTLAVRVLIRPDLWEICREAEDEEDIRFILRNQGRVSECGSLDKLKRHFCDHDPYVMEIKEFLNLEPEFYEKYKKETEAFFLRNAEIALAYLHNDTFKAHHMLKEKYRLILKAAVCGKLNALKFHDGDLNRETGTRLAPEIIREWETDRNMQLKNRQVFEDSSFEGIMAIGESPHHTCMSYINGLYAYCLLSYFDANKKVVYVKDQSGHVAARAVMRLTKATDMPSNKKEALSFVDVEADTDTAAAEEKTEYPVLFLEHLYTGCQDKMRETLEQDMIRFAAEKANAMHVKLVVANDYTSCTDWKKERIGIYITRSKSGYQYLDSFNGMHANGDDDHYEYSHCYMKDC